MALIGRRNLLTVTREASPGLYLDGGSHGEILLPKKFITDRAVPGSKLDVFVYRDSEDRLVATTETPKAMVGDFAFLEVISWDRELGAFLDWGLPKDLLLPRREQTSPLRPGDWIVVHISLDQKSDRIIASARLNLALGRKPANYTPYQPVKLLIAEETPLGYNAIVENSHRGLLYRENLTRPVRIGDRLEGYVRTTRPDGKLDLSLEPVGFQRVTSLTEQILAGLQGNGGFLPYHDKTSPEEIRSAFGVSKKVFKQALGALYRSHRISLDPDGIRLLRGSKK